MTEQDINKIPITVEVPKADIWVRNDYRDIVRRLGEVHLIRACAHQHDDDFVPLYDSETVAKYQVEAAAARGEMDAANSFHRVAIAERNHERTVNARLAVENHELALLVRRLALALRKAQPEHSTVSDDAMEYLRSIGRAGEVMR